MHLEEKATGLRRLECRRDRDVGGDSFLRWGTGPVAARFPEVEECGEEETWRREGVLPLSLCEG